LDFRSKVLSTEPFDAGPAAAPNVTGGDLLLYRKCRELLERGNISGGGEFTLNVQDFILALN
jgi:hypothetical protein